MRCRLAKVPSLAADEAAALDPSSKRLVLPLKFKPAAVNSNIVRDSRDQVMPDASLAALCAILARAMAMAFGHSVKSSSESNHRQLWTYYR